MNPIPFMVSVATSISLVIGALTALFPTPTPASPPAAAQAAPTTVPEPPRSPSDAPKYQPALTLPTIPTCDDYGRLAIEVGWPAELIPTLTQIMFAESGCRSNAIGDLNRGESIGLMQIHTDSWCEPTRYYPLGYLQTMSVLDYCHTLLDPYVNLYAALLIYREGGWQQWTTYKGN